MFMLNLPKIRPEQTMQTSKSPVYNIHLKAARYENLGSFFIDGSSGLVSVDSWSAVTSM